MLDVLWRWQAKKRNGIEISSVTKMALGCFILGASYLVMAICAIVTGTGQGSVLWLVLYALLLSTGELYLSPIGLSLVSKVAPAKIVSTLMGLWFISIFFGATYSGSIGVLYEKGTFSPVGFFLFCAGILGVVGLVMTAFQKPLKRAIGKENKSINEHNENEDNQDQVVEGA